MAYVFGPPCICYLFASCFLCSHWKTRQTVFVDFPALCFRDCKHATENQCCALSNGSRKPETKRHRMNNNCGQVFVNHVHISKWFGGFIVEKKDGKYMDDTLNKSNQITQIKHYLYIATGHWPLAHNVASESEAYGIIRLNIRTTTR